MPGHVRRVKLWCVIAAVAMIAFTWGITAFAMHGMWRAAMDRTRSNGANLAAAFQDEVLRTLDNVDLIMQSLIRGVHADGDQLHHLDWAHEIQPHSREISQVGIIGADGRLAWSSRNPKPQPIDLSDREHFRVHVHGDTGTLFIGKPVVGRVSHQATIMISRRIETNDGGFLGVLVVSVTPGQLTTLNHSIDLGDRGTIALIGMDDVIRARFSAASLEGLDGIGQSVHGGPRRTDIAAGSRGFYIAKSVIDHITRLYSYHRVGTYPLVVTVGLDLDAALAPDRAYITTAIWRAVIATLVICAFFAYLARDIEGRAAREQALARERNRLQEANAELERAITSRKHAESASHAKSLFLANMSHELRTPLNAIIGFSQIIRDEIMGPAGTPSYVSYAKDICGAGEHLLATINGILDISKIESGRFELHNEPVDLRDIIETALAAVRNQAQQKRIAIAIALPDHLPTVIADQLALRQVLINLLANAVKFTPDAGHVGIRVEGAPGGGFAIVITDTGIGMSQDDMAIAFELFGQVENAMTKRHDGTGLGLPLARRLIELHGGTIELASHKNDGTTVRIILPAARIAPVVITAAA